MFWLWVLIRKRTSKNATSVVCVQVVEGSGTFSPRTCCSRERALSPRSVGEKLLGIVEACTSDRMLSTCAVASAWSASTRVITFSRFRACRSDVRCASHAQLQAIKTAPVSKLCCAAHWRERERARACCLTRAFRVGIVQARPLCRQCRQPMAPTPAWILIARVYRLDAPTAQHRHTVSTIRSELCTSRLFHTPCLNPFHTLC